MDERDVSLYRILHKIETKCRIPFHATLSVHDSVLYNEVDFWWVFREGRPGRK